MPTHESPHFGIVTLLDAQPAWLALSRDRRAELAAELGGIFADAAVAVQVRYFDAEAFGHGYTDFIFAETSDLAAYNCNAMGKVQRSERARRGFRR
jgi:hypothetical protein